MILTPNLKPQTSNLKTALKEKKFAPDLISPLTSHQFFNQSLIKKGRGIWPDEALTTCPAISGIRCQLHHAERVTDKSDQSLHY
jgi:hypothetical protein